MLKQPKYIPKLVTFWQQLLSSLNWEEATITGRESDWTTQWIREAVKIRPEGQDIMNRDEGSYCCPMSTTTYYSLQLQL